MKEDNEIRIALYLEDKMTTEEEEAFVRDLGTDETLRQQYEEELLMQSLWEDKEREQPGEPDWFLQGADEHVRMVEAALGESAEEEKAWKMPAYIRWGMAAAAVLLVVVVVSIVLRKDKTPIARDKGNGKPVDTGLAVRPNGVDHPGPDLGGLYTRFYTKFSGYDVPVEISDYYNDYREGDYASVLAVQPTEYQAMGAGGRQAVLREYMQLLKGLSYLGLNEPGKAGRQFDSVMLSAGKETRLYYGAQWYDALAWLRLGDTAKVLGVARVVAGGGSPYKGQAKALVDSLSR